jgi:hypothetical protein
LNSAVTPHQPRSAGRWVVAALVISAFAGCADAASDSSGSVPLGTNPSQSTSTTAAPAAGPAAPPPTVAGQTTIASTIPAPLDPSVEQAIKQGIQAFFTAYMACGQAPATCHAADFHSTRGTAVGQGTVYFQGLAARGEYFASDLRGSYIVTQSVALEDPTSAVTFSCWYDASILLGPVDGTGSPAVLTDKIISVREKQALYFDGTAWKVGEAATVQDLGDGNKCPPPDATG